MDLGRDERVWAGAVVCGRGGSESASTEALHQQADRSKGFVLLAPQPGMGARVTCRLEIGILRPGGVLRWAQQ